MKEFLFNYGWILVIILGFILYLIVKAKKEGKAEALKTARETAYKLMLAAEKKFGQDAGEEKFKFVVERFYPMLPKSAQFFFTQSDIEGYLQDLYNEFMDFLDDGKLDYSYNK
jgi:hypothetical protein